MNRITSFLALSAIVVAGAFAGTAAQASANVTVSFNVHNDDGSASMIRTATSAGISGLITPAAPILAGNDDPASGAATFSLPNPAVNGSVQGSVSYALASDGVSSPCTFTMTVTRTGIASYALHFSVAPTPSNCSVPGDASNSTGLFTAMIYGLHWKR